jgi:hypothetical protein
VKYFFLSEGWTIGRVWSSEGLWRITAWRREPDITKMDICLVEKGEILWLYRVEDEVITVEVKPSTPDSGQGIGQVILKRLISAQDVLERLGTGEAICQIKNIKSVVY